MISVATNAGINRIQYHRQDSVIIDHITPLDMTDGLLSNDVNDILIRDSLIYIATSQGLSVLDKTRIASSLFYPYLYSALKINDHDSAVHSGLYDLSYNQNDIKIEYIGILQPVAGDIRYQYRLLGSGDDRWETTGNTSIDFRSLSPGIYTFQVVALDKFGNRINGTSQYPVSFITGILQDVLVLVADICSNTGCRFLYYSQSLQGPPKTISERTIPKQ
jgi:hypothetical protein